MSTATQIVRSVRPGPVFLGVVAVAVVGGVLLAQSTPGRNATSIVGALLLVVGGWVISLCLHEFGHAVTAFAFGDKNAENRGYLTLNPLKYAHPGLSITLPLVIILLGGIGFPGGAVYVNQAGFSKAQRTIVSLAGPFANIVVGVVLLAVIRAKVDEISIANINLWSALGMLALLQITAAILNLIPIPGFDGYGAIEPYLSIETRRKLAPVGQYGFLLVFLVLLLPPLNRAFFDLIYWFFELSGVSSTLASIGYGLVVFWR
ncbi:site-2 protease family protein [Williamsia sp.]|uniref:site-2 protease family protein n=1 Tax=Williamsia sp. TaxID=1872085 RepID=UPI001A30CFAB|nr:site-2 protease family protein [Williamsia sp.]MBJ7290732.1 site-2 protease family protein [Williamsia sp.]